MDVVTIVELVGAVVEGIGVFVIVVGAFIATLVFVSVLHKGEAFSKSYLIYRRGLGRAILLGLEFLIAGNIIRTVAVRPTFTGLGILAGIVLIRTFLSFSLELEIEGNWSWRRSAERNR